MLRVNDGGTVCFNLGTGKNSKLAAPYVFLDGTLKVNLLSGYTPKAGDKFTLWEASVIFSGSPTLALPQLPEGLYWDTTDLLKQTGVIAVTDKPTGIDTVKEETTDDKRCYDVQGRRTDLNAKGIKIINGRKFIQ